MTYFSFDRLTPCIFFESAPTLLKEISVVSEASAKLVFRLVSLNAFAVRLDHDDTKPVVPRPGMRLCQKKNQNEISNCLSKGNMSP
jgi:hypothetical protein